ncbi:MAG TPA: hypothetical protein PKN33_21145 [Phycisphaerae bacterium]|nr:hypothetical protein [Phycisphaerae bacterium]
MSYDNGLDPTRIAFRPPATDCNFDNVLDPCEIAAGTSQDCNSNAIPDQCEVYQDCNTNSIRDICDIASEFSTDCDGDNVPDECEADCNTNGIADDCDIVAGTSTDCNGNTIPDLCEAFFDCNSNSIKDMCDIADGTSGDCDNDGIPDECESDCNENTVPDDCEIAAGSSADCDGDGTPDECEPDCNSNGIADDCDIAGSTSRDCNDNLIPDECDVSAGTSIDCNANIVPDECEICLNDCNTNSVPDDCDVAGTTSSDVNSNDIPDECEDCNTNGTLDFNEDCDTNGYAFRHDYDRDGDHDLRDFWYFQRCFNTNGVGTNGVTVADCLCAFDWDTNGVRDSIIDLNDFLSLVDDESFGLEPQIACWYAAQDQECTAGGQMEMLMGGGGGESQMMMAESEESFEQEAEEGPPEITVEYADLEFELRPGGSEEAAEILEPNTVYELHYVADSNYVNDYVLEVVATTSAQGLTAVVQAPSGDWSATGNFVFEDVVTAYGSLIPAPGYPEGYYRTDWILDTFFPYSGKAAGEAGHLCNITTGSEGELELVLHMIWFDLENSHLKIMEAVLAFDVEADD